MGYWEKYIGDNVWIVDYVASYNRNVLALEYHNIYRCAELTLKEGFKYFFLLEHNSSEGYRKLVGNENYSNVKIEKYALKPCYSKMIIKMYKIKPNKTIKCINAFKVVKYYGEYIEKEQKYSSFFYNEKYIAIKTIINCCNE